MGRAARLTKEEEDARETGVPDDRGGEWALGSFPARPLDRKDGPLYRQIADIIRGAAESGRLPPGTALPREADLAASFGVSLITVRQALRELETEGRVRKQSAKPTVVTRPPPRPGTAFSFTGLEAIVASTAGRRIEILDYRKRRSATAREVFALPPNRHPYCLEAILHAADRPVTHATIFFPPAIGRRLSRESFDDVVVFRSVQRHLGIALRGARVRVRAEVADARLARLLDYEEGGAVMAMEILYFDVDGAPVELAVNRNRADCFSLEFDAPNDLK